MKNSTTLSCSLLALACASGALAQGLPAPTPAPAALGDVTLTALEGDGSFQRFSLEADGDYRLEAGPSASAGQLVARGVLDATRLQELQRSLAALRLSTQAPSAIEPFARWVALEIDGPAPFGGYVSGQLGRFADPHLEAAFEDLERLATALLTEAAPGAGGLAGALGQTRVLEGRIRGVDSRTHVFTPDGVHQVEGRELNTLARAYPGLRVRVRVREIADQPASLPWNLEVVELLSLNSASLNGVYELSSHGARLHLPLETLSLDGPRFPALNNRDVIVEVWQLLDAEGRPSGQRLIKGFAVQLSATVTVPGAGAVGASQLFPGAQLLAVGVDGDRVRLNDRSLSQEFTAPKPAVLFHGWPAFHLP